ncbi:hypothetical protein AB6A40_008334 [Gnathostoma spinigerum]|uniref:glucuronosyltransferase n=1 Tax=Gnathostoma spinigerum TaxID=75299 RepID=A0ABD6EQ18_9BILA
MKENFKTFGNIHFFKWIPQIDLLGNPKTRAFITHGGMNSVIEASVSGVPIIGIPIYADQYVNTAVAVKRGYGIRILKKDVNKKSLTKALQAILSVSNSSNFYIKNVDLAKRFLPNRSDELVRNIKRWTREVVEFGTMEHLNLIARDYSTIKYYNIDVICSVIFISLFLFILASCLLIIFLRLFCNNRSSLSNLPDREKIE